MAQSGDDSVASPVDPRVGKFVVLLSCQSDNDKDKKKKTKTKDWNALPPRLARIAAGNNCDNGYVNVVMYALASLPTPSPSSPSPRALYPSR